jgi:hypothetical protein
MSQLRKFLAGSKDAQANYPTDILIWLNFEGSKHAGVKGKPSDALIKRDDHASVSLEKYLSKFVEYLFRSDISRMKKEELYIRFTNRMDKDDAEIVYAATEGTLDLDLDLVRKYAGDRRLTVEGQVGAYIFREEYLVNVPEKLVVEKKKNAAPADFLDGLGEILQPLEDGEDETPPDVSTVPAEGTPEQPKKRRGGRRPKVAPEA